MSRYQTFVVPFDFSEHARAALDRAIDLARRLGADVHLVHVVPVPSYAYGYGPPAPPAVDAQGLRQEAMKALREVIAERGELPVRLEPQVAESTAVPDAICTLARDLEADLIVMGTHGRTGLAHVFLGSVAERTLRRSSCPVLTVRAADGD